MTNTKTLLKFGPIEINMRNFHIKDQTGTRPMVFHNKVCNWYDVYGVKYLNTCYYIIISHIGK